MSVVDEIVSHLDDIAYEEISEETKDIWREYLNRKLILAGWFCDCGIFNGEEKERQETCRTYAKSRPH